jgi:hypothetical protein
MEHTTPAIIGPGVASDARTATQSSGVRSARSIVE